MRSDYDVIVIGAGHNGLVVAAYLANRGERVLILEARDVLGGAAATEEIFPGYQVDTGADHASLFRTEIATELGLEKHGLEFLESPISALALTPGDALRIWRDPNAARKDIERHSNAAAARYLEFLSWIEALI